ncbi:MAG: thymidine kinase [Lachnospiraceae bacterium]|nr:thymidine kinase [Lachnospiraceae bacterium]
MSKLYFKYGAMGSSKSAQALITQFNYEELGMKVWLIKPSIDDRDGADIIKSRIGLSRKAMIIKPDDSIYEMYKDHKDCDVIISDESQFFTPKQIDELRAIVDDLDVPVICYGLRTDFRTKFFPGSMRLMELADSLTEIKTVCSCGSKAMVNARLDPNGRIITEGSQVFLGGNDSYKAMCHKCWIKKIKEQQKGEQ